MSRLSLAPDAHPAAAVGSGPGLRRCNRLTPTGLPVFLATPSRTPVGPRHFSRTTANRRFPSLPFSIRTGSQHTFMAGRPPSGAAFRGIREVGAQFPDDRGPPRRPSEAPWPAATARSREQPMWLSISRPGEPLQVGTLNRRSTCGETSGSTSNFQPISASMIQCADQHTDATTSAAWGSTSSAVTVIAGVAGSARRRSSRDESRGGPRSIRRHSKASLSKPKQQGRPRLPGACAGSTIGPVG